MNDATGGWLKDHDAVMDRRYRRLEEVDRARMNPDYLAYFDDYIKRYFNDRLIPGQGAEVILALLDACGDRPRHWIDLGAGVTTLFWSIAVNDPRDVSVCDLVPEALHLLSDFKNGEEVPPCYADAMALLGRSHDDFERTRRKDWTYHIFDCLASWSIPDRDRGFDLMTAIGCFGLAPNADGYGRAFSAAAANLSPGGCIVGADWIRSGMFIEEEGHDNRYLSPALTAACACEADLRMLSVTKVNIVDDPFYDSVIVWAFKRPGFVKT